MKIITDDEVMMNVFIETSTLKKSVYLFNDIHMYILLFMEFLKV